MRVSLERLRLTSWVGVNSKSLGAFVAVENPFKKIKIKYLILSIKQKKEGGYVFVLL